MSLQEEQEVGKYYQCNFQVEQNPSIYLISPKSSIACMSMIKGFPEENFTMYFKLHAHKQFAWVDLGGFGWVYSHCIAVFCPSVYIVLQCTINELKCTCTAKHTQL